MITVQFVNETQGTDLSIEPILITVTEDYELAYNITGVQTKTFEATITELKEKVSSLEINLSDDANDRNALIGRIEMYKDAISNDVPYNLATLLLAELTWNPLNLSNIRYRLEDVASGKQNGTNHQLTFISQIYDALFTQLGINQKDYSS